MTRKEGVKLLCSKWYPTYPDSPTLDEEIDKYNIEQLKKRHIVERAVEWADKTMIDKACEWLFDNFRISSFDSQKIVTDFTNMYDLRDSFIKATEE